MWFIEPLTFVSPVIFVIISIIIPIYTKKIKELHLLILLIILNLKEQVNIYNTTF